MSRRASMAKTKVQEGLQGLPGTVAHEDVAFLGDGELLTRHIADRDEQAFALLVRRHAAMVLGVCRRVLGNDADAEDAFQATFLVLVRKAASVRQRGAVGNWLYGVAHNTALKAKAMIHKRRAKERQASTQPPDREATWLQIQELVDAELSRLPERYRIPIVLCDLEGKTIKEAMRHLGWPQGTVASRLARGRALLASRLSKVGVALSAGVLAHALAETASAAAPAQLITTTTQAATLYGAGQTAAACGASANAALLTDGVLKTMLLAKLKLAAAALTLIGLLSVAVGAVALQEQKGEDKVEANVEEVFLQAPTPAIPPQPEQGGALGPVRALDYGQDDVIALAIGAKVHLGGPRMRTVLLGHADEVTCLAFDNRARTTLATGSKDGAVRLWDSNGKLLRVLKDGKGAVHAVTFSLDQRYKFVAAAGEDGIIRVWNPATGQQVCDFAGHEGPVRALAFARASFLTLVSGGDDKTVRLWYPSKDVQPKSFDGAVLAKGTDPNLDLKLPDEADLQPAILHVHDAPVRTLAFGPGRLAVGDDAGVLRVWVPMGGALWRPQPGVAPLVLRGHAGPVRTLVFHAYQPGGATMVSGGDDGKVIVWDAVAGRRLETLQAHHHPIQALAIHPLGHDLLTGDADGKLLRWPSRDRPRPAFRPAWGAPKSVPKSKQAEIPSTPAPAPRPSPVPIPPPAPAPAVALAPLLPPAPVPEAKTPSRWWVGGGVILGLAIVAVVLGAAVWRARNRTRRP
jgi:RNA polymerase sigma factor (sigma-70 family)